MVNLLKRLRISGEALARHYGVSARTSYRWRHGHCPDSVRYDLESLAQVMDELDEIRKA